MRRGHWLMYNKHRYCRWSSCDVQLQTALFSKIFCWFFSLPKKEKWLSMILPKIYNKIHRTKLNTRIVKQYFQKSISMKFHYIKCQTLFICIMYSYNGWIRSNRSQRSTTVGDSAGEYAEQWRVKGVQCKTVRWSYSCCTVEHSSLSIVWYIGKQLTSLHLCTNVKCFLNR